MNVPDERGLKRGLSGPAASGSRRRDERPRREGIETYIASATRFLVPGEMNVPDERGLKRGDPQSAYRPACARRDERPRREGIETLFSSHWRATSSSTGEMNVPDERGLKLEPERARQLLGLLEKAR
jgi:hypothetical protein